MNDRQAVAVQKLVDAAHLVLKEECSASFGGTCANRGHLAIRVALAELRAAAVTVADTVEIAR